MTRYSGQKLEPGCRIAVIANDAIGNFVVATPLLQMLRSHLIPSKIIYFGGTRTTELQSASDLFEVSDCLHGASAMEFAAMVLSREGSFDLVFNCEQTAMSKVFAGLIAKDGYVAGPCMNPGGRGDMPYQEDSRGDLWRDKEWVAEDLTKTYPFLESGFIGEIFCRLAYLQGPIPAYKVPVDEPFGEVPDVLIATSASLPEKLWPVERWLAALRRIQELGLAAGLIGAAPAAQKEYWKGHDLEGALVQSGLVRDLRGTYTLPQVVGALAAAKAVLTLDNGILHLAVATPTPVVGLYRHGIHRLWAPPAPTLQVLTPGEGAPVSQIEVKEVTEALERAL